MKWLDLWWPLLMWLVLAAAGAAVCLPLWWAVRPRRLLQRWRRWRAPWTGLDVVAVLFLSQLVPSAVYLALVRLGVFELRANDAEPVPPLDLLWAQLLALPAQVLLIVSALWLSRGARPERLGLTLRRPARNVIAGYLVWLVVTPPLFALYFALQQFIPTPRHPLERVDVATAWPLLLLGVVVAAPLAEELVFRGVLLPWSLNAPPDRQFLVGAGALVMACVQGIKKSGAFDPAPAAFIAVLLLGYLVLPYFAPRCRLADPQDTSGLPWWQAWWRRLLERAGLPRARPLLAVFGNGLLFAAVHSSVWPSPVPLVLLGWALAWLAYRTQSLVGPVLVHALFNGVTFLTLVSQPAPL
jgi:membrane protease YdiL (CAAX protease family)